MQQEPLNLNGTTIRRVPNYLNPQRPAEYELRSGNGGGGGAVAAGGLLLHPLVLVIAILGLVVFLLYMLFQHVIKPLIRWIFRIATPRDSEDPIPSGLIPARQRIDDERAEIERAMRANPSDPALLPRIEKLTAEVESLDRTVLHRLNQQARRAFGSESA